jgi:hypothetical protein
MRYLYWPQAWGVLQEEKDNEILFNSSRYSNKHGIGCNPKKNMPKLLARRNSKGASSRRLELIVVIARMLDITLGSSLFLRAFHLLCSLTLHLALRELTIILWRQRVKGKFIGIQAKGKLPNKTWVPKSLADHYWRPLLGSPRSEGFMRKGR